MPSRAAAPLLLRLLRGGDDDRSGERGVRAMLDEQRRLVDTTPAPASAHAAIAAALAAAIRR